MLDKADIKMLSQPRIERRKWACFCPPGDGWAFTRGGWRFGPHGFKKSPRMRFCAYCGAMFVGEDCAELNGDTARVDMMVMLLEVSMNGSENGDVGSAELFLSASDEERDYSLWTSCDDDDPYLMAQGKTLREMFDNT